VKPLEVVEAVEVVRPLGVVEAVEVVKSLDKHG
jgi:hypothetical protein